MASLRRTWPFILAVALAACSQLQDLKSSSQDSSRGENPSSSTQTATATATATASATSTQSDTSDDVSSAASELETPGLPDICNATPSNDAKLCITCTPRTLPVMHCEDSALTSFRAEARCSHDLDLVICDLGNQEPFRFDLEAQSPAEIIYDRFPLLLFGLKLLLGSQMDGQDAQKQVLFDVIDSMQKNSFALFTCGDLTPIIKDLGKAAKTYDSNLTDEMIAIFEVFAQSEFGKFKNFCELGLISHDNLIKAVSKLVTLIPGGIGDNLEIIDIASILNALQNSSSTPGMSDVLDGQNLDQSINEIEKATSP